MTRHLRCPRCGTIHIASADFAAPGGCSRTSCGQSSSTFIPMPADQVPPRAKSKPVFWEDDPAARSLAAHHVAILERVGVGICRWNDVSWLVADARWRGRPFAAALGWEGPTAKPHDGRVERLVCGTPQLVLEAFDVQDPIEAGSPTIDQVEDALGFVRQHAGPDGHVLVNCHAGIARSTALALGILADRLGPGREAEALDLLLEVRPQAAPNILIVQHADRVLGRRGALERVVLDHPGVGGRRRRLEAVRQAYHEGHGGRR